MTEPKRCPCRSSHYNTRLHPHRWYWAESIDGYAIPASFCLDCGAHLLPNGEVEPRGEVVGEGILYLGHPFVDSIAINYNAVCSIEGRVLLVRPAAKESESDG